MGEIAWLASYPKSGNTWLRVLLKNYLGSSDGPADINRMNENIIASDRKLFDELTGLESTGLEEESITRLRPGVYQALAREAPGRLYVKVHDAWTRTEGSGPLFPPEITAGTVYVLRNPLDLVASIAHHWGIHADQALDFLCDPSFSLARSIDHPASQLRQFLGSWTGHALSWLDAAELPVHLVRYEDLLREPARAFEAVLVSLGVAVEPDRLARAVAFSDFKLLKSQEEQAGFKEKPRNGKGQFFRQGTSGQWREELTPAQVRRLVESQGAAMARFGYLDTRGEPV